jgi:hypothetical protein
MALKPITDYVHLTIIGRPFTTLKLAVDFIFQVSKEIFKSFIRFLLFSYWIGDAPPDPSAPSTYRNVAGYEYRRLPHENSIRLLKGLDKARDYRVQA